MFEIRKHERYNQVKVDNKLNVINADANTDKVILNGHCRSRWPSYEEKTEMKIRR